jgi:hypothetical protein
MPPPDLAPLRARDPDLSIPALEDFMFQLFSAAHRRRDNPAALVALQPYLDPRASAQIGIRGEAPKQIVIGTLRITGYRPATETSDDLLVVRIEATMHTSSPKYVVEDWSFVRSATAKSKPPQGTYTWPCPNCGAAWRGDVDRKCQHCGETMQTGKFDWCVGWVELVSQKDVLASLTGTVPEYGNDLPRCSARAAQRWRRSPPMQSVAVAHRAGAQLNDAGTQNLMAVRGLTTPLHCLQYWTTSTRQGLHNRLANAKIEYIELAKVIRDRHFDAITMRVRAGGNDFTLDAKEKLVGGSPTFFRRYTEYWTFLRASSRRGPVLTTPACPNCGGALAISDAGTCTHCNAFVESGSFDWTLSKIEQDDTYAG